MLVIGGLIVLNGVFAMSELALVSAKPSHLRAQADKGSRGAVAALRLAEDPGKFLSTVQIGITLVVIVAGAYSGASLGGPVGERLAALGLPVGYADEVGFALVIALTTYASLIVGELVPKQIALRAAVPIAVLMARPMALVARVAAPLVWLLDTSSRLLLRLLRVQPGGDGNVTAEELRMIFAEATHSGVIEREQHQMLAGVVRLAERPVRELMTPRKDIDWVDAGADAEQLRAAFERSPHSLLPVVEGTPEQVVGIIKVRDVLAAMVGGELFDLSRHLKRAEIVPDQLDAVDALRTLQGAEVAMAMVHDEYGHLDGLVTPADLLTALVGGFASDQDERIAPDVIERRDGSLLVSGSMSADLLADRLGLDYGPDRDFATVAGFVLAILRKLPEEGEQFVEQGWSFEVIDLDGRRIDKLIVRPAGVSDQVSVADNHQNPAA
ncbi:MAG TPA: hemolysin family protein [Lautropia sp.]|nr:hemolysin family protein [Lautropia sp.]